MDCGGASPALLDSSSSFLTVGPCVCTQDFAAAESVHLHGRNTGRKLDVWDHGRQVSDEQAWIYEQKHSPSRLNTEGRPGSPENPERDTELTHPSLTMSGSSAGITQLSLSTSHVSPPFSSPSQYPCEASMNVAVNCILLMRTLRSRDVR